MQHVIKKPLSPETIAQAERRVRKFKVRLMLRHPFLGPLVAKLEAIADETCDTAWTDGTQIGYNPAYMMSLTDEELLFVLAHEVMHCVLLHCWRRGNRDQQLWNVACDYVANLYLVRAGFKMPEGALFDERFDKLAAEPVYAMVKKEQQQQQQQPPKPDQGDQGSQGGDQGDQGDQGDTGDQGGQGGKPQPVLGGEVRDAKEGEATQSEWMSAAQTANKMAAKAGNASAVGEQIIDTLVESQRSWRALLQEFVNNNARNDWTYQRANRRYSRGRVVMPSLRSEQVPPVAFVRDVSGSMDRDALRAVTSELVAAVNDLKPEGFVVIDCNTKVTKVQEFEHGAEIDEDAVRKATKGGGTRFAPGFEEAQKHDPCCIVYFTDGEADFPPEPDVPVLWAISEDCANRYYGEPPYGQVVYLGKGEY